VVKLYVEKKFSEAKEKRRWFKILFWLTKIVFNLTWMSAETKQKPLKIK
jgi:hypothetical protein